MESARAGFTAVGLRTSPVAPGAIHYPLKAGSAEHRRLARLLDDHGTTVREVEFIPILPEIVVSSYEAMFEAAAGLGAQTVTVSGDDSDFSRLVANFVALCDLAAGFGLRIDLEFMRWRHVGTLGDARRVLDAAARPNGSILVDSLHLMRSGATPADVSELPAAYLHSVQICDAPAVSPVGDDAIIREARGPPAAWPRCVAARGAIAFTTVPYAHQRRNAVRGAQGRPTARAGVQGIEASDRAKPA
ncbi:TIM barrel protein [Burkholderia sp. THE68]|uniref:sugar phosphate isomerase/epimerase family protein n=1 Tax=Burkholderia sp. THE68 TaxID=758782 RepID=UPI0018D731F3|nr:TIM barrel protein [Burkholderia sp. THE68]